jgi:HTH-type transcriptional regulator, transcriptional repressor of NAD biosynthesis genes
MSRATGERGLALPTRRIAILGAESTGKSWLAQALAEAIGAAKPDAHAQHPTVHTVGEVLRSWCEREGRTPQAHEQAHIAQQQADAVAHAQGDWVIADTTPLMTAVYSHLLFDDTRLYPMALAHHALYAHTLVTGLDLPWVADGLQRDGPQVRGPVDTLLRQALDGAGLPYRVIYGQGPQRLNNALLALGLPGTDLAAQTTRDKAQFAINQGRNAWQCNDCSDPECEHTLFTRLLQPREPNESRSHIYQKIKK